MPSMSFGRMERANRFPAVQPISGRKSCCAREQAGRSRSDSVSVMTKMRHKFREPKSRPIQTDHRRIRSIVLVCATEAMLGLGWSVWYWSTAPASPSVSFAEVDPAVVDAIEGARRQVWWRPHSAAAWGRLGQLLRAHSYELES